MLAGAHKKMKKSYRIQHPEIYLLDLKVQNKHKIKLPFDMVSKHVFLYLCLPDYQYASLLHTTHDDDDDDKLSIYKFDIYSMHVS